MEVQLGAPIQVWGVGFRSWSSIFLASGLRIEGVGPQQRPIFSLEVLGLRGTFVVSCSRFRYYLGGTLHREVVVNQVAVLPVVFPERSPLGIRVYSL